MTFDAKELDLIYSAVDYTYHYHQKAGSHQPFVELRERIRLELTKSFDLDKINNDLYRTTGIKDAWARNEDGTATYVKKDEVAARLLQMQSEGKFGEALESRPEV